MFTKVKARTLPVRFFHNRTVYAFLGEEKFCSKVWSYS